MDSDADFRELAALYNLRNFSSISDPDKEYYGAFGVRRATYKQMYGWRTWIKSLRLKRLCSSMCRRSLFDPYQMAGVFYVFNDRIRELYRPRYVGDIPDFNRLLHEIETHHEWREKCG